MPTYQIKQMCFGFVIEQTRPDNTRPFYLAKVYKNQFAWYRQLHNAKPYKTRKSAEKMLLRICFHDELQQMIKDIDRRTKQ